MLTAKKLLLLLILSASALPLGGCALDTGDDEDDGETEPVGESNDELRSLVSCKEETDTAYAGGKPYTVPVIHVGGKAVVRATGHAFLKMQAAALAEGVRVSLTSGFRTNAEQQYLYGCYESKKCNHGNLAARPGYSNHQSGLALDVPSSAWLARNAMKFGFSRPVRNEAWHLEFRGSDPGGPCTRGTPPPEPATTGGDDDPSTSGTAPMPRPPAEGGLTWLAPAQDSTLKNGFPVRAHANKPGIVKVIYSQGTFVFGTSTVAESDFTLSYRFKYMGDKTLTAKGYDAKGTLIAVDHVDFTLLP